MLTNFISVKFLEAFEKIFWHDIMTKKIVLLQNNLREHQFLCVILRKSLSAQPYLVKCQCPF